MNATQRGDAPPTAVAPSDDVRNSQGPTFSEEDLRLPLPALPEPFICATDIGYALHRAPEVLRFGADCYRLALASTQPSAALTSAPAEPHDDPAWIVNSLGELGVYVNGRFFFLYKGDNIEYGEPGAAIALRDDGTPMKYRVVGKREFGEVQWPEAWVLAGRREDEYTEELTFTVGLSDGAPGDGDWRDLPAPAEQFREVQPDGTTLDVDPAETPPAAGAIDAHEQGVPND